MAQQHDTSSAVGVVVIGRNDGDRLKGCLSSVLALTDRIVYVDSGSTDGSVGMSRACGVDVLKLDLGTPFTAARAGNEGFRRLAQTHPRLQYVLFVDRDCEEIAGWLDQATRFLEAHQDVAVAWGRRRGRYPEKSVYNLLCDIEWESFPVGEAKGCGGMPWCESMPFAR